MREGLWKWPKSQKDGWDRSMTIIDTHLRRKWRSSTTLCCFHFCFDGIAERAERRRRAADPRSRTQELDDVFCCISTQWFTRATRVPRELYNFSKYTKHRIRKPQLWVELQWVKKPLLKLKKSFLFVHVRILWLDSVIIYSALFSSAAVFFAPSFAFLCHFWSWKQWHGDDMALRSKSMKKRPFISKWIEPFAVIFWELYTLVKIEIGWTKLFIHLRVVNLKYLTKQTCFRKH